MPVQFTNLTGKIGSILIGGPPFTAHEVVIGGTTGGLAQVPSTGTAGEVLTSNGPGADPSWQPGGGGGSGTRMPWDVLGGWLGSTCDIGLAIGPITGTLALDNHLIHADAIVCGEAGSFDVVAMLGGGAQTGTGAQVVVTDTSGNWLSHATNADAAFQGIATSLEWVYLTMNTTVTVTAGQVVYVMRLFPSATVAGPPQLWFGPQIANWIPNQPGGGAPTQSSVANVSDASSAGTPASIPNPQPLSGLTSASNSPPWAALVAL